MKIKYLMENYLFNFLLYSSFILSPLFLRATPNFFKYLNSILSLYLNQKGKCAKLNVFKINNITFSIKIINPNPYIISYSRNSFPFV